MMNNDAMLVYMIILSEKICTLYINNVSMLLLEGSFLRGLITVTDAVKLP